MTGDNIREQVVQRIAEILALQNDVRVVSDIRGLPNDTLVVVLHQLEHLIRADSPFAHYVLRQLEHLRQALPPRTPIGVARDLAINEALKEKE